MLIAASIWTAAGVLLLSMGVFWMETGLGWGLALLLAVPCVLVGMAKGHFLLDRVAQRSIARICERGPDAPLWGFYGVRTWLLVVVMMGTGIGLRVLFNFEHWQFFYLGFLYVAIGTALILASRRMWQTAVSPPAEPCAAG
jgi:mannose/fructose/N-acetylgalactosamine-specific phosphotransferase system component IIC